MQTKRRQLYESLGLFFGSLLVFTWGLRGQEITGFDSRFYLFALEMWHHGPQWFPTTYQHLYPDYLVTSTWLIYLISTVFGHLNKLTAVLPSALCAAGTITATYLIGARWDRRWGLYAACFLLMTIGFLKSARSISLDMYPTLLTTLIFYLLYSAEEHPRHIIWIYPLLFLSFLFRGPIGLVVPTGVMCSYFLLRHQFRQLAMHGLLAFILLLVCCGMLVALAYHAGGYTFLQEVLRMQVLGRLDNPFLPRYFYFTNSMGNNALSYPLALVTIAGASYYWWFSHPVKHGRDVLQLAGWMLVVMLGMSIPDDKKIRYILPMLPATALLAAYAFAGMSQQKFFFRLRCAQWIMWLFTAVFLTTYLGLVEPIALSFEKGRQFVAITEAARAAANAPLVFYRQHPDGLPIKYLINAPHPVQPQFSQDPYALLKAKVPTYFVTSEEYFYALPNEVRDRMRIIYQDKLGHVRVISFTQRSL